PPPGPDAHRPAEGRYGREAAAVRGRAPAPIRRAASEGARDGGAHVGHGGAHGRALGLGRPGAARPGGARGRNASRAGRPGPPAVQPGDPRGRPGRARAAPRGGRPTSDSREPCPVKAPMAEAKDEISARIPGIASGFLLGTRARVGHWGRYELCLTARKVGATRARFSSAHPHFATRSARAPVEGGRKKGGVPHLSAPPSSDRGAGAPTRRTRISSARIVIARPCACRLTALLSYRRTPFPARPGRRRCAGLLLA